jgi:hypothetical protein
MENYSVGSGEIIIKLKGETDGFWRKKNGRTVIDIAFDGDDFDFLMHYSPFACF